MAAASRVDTVDFAHISSIEALQFSGAKKVNLETTAAADGLQTVLIGSGSPSITDTNARNLST